MRCKSGRRDIWLSLLVVFLVFGFMPDAAAKTLKLGHVAPVADNAYQTASSKFAELVEAKTKGKIKIKIFGNHQLGSSEAHWAMLKKGAIDLWAPDQGGTLVVEPPPKNLMVAAFPYVVESRDHLYKFFKSDIYKDSMARSEKAGNFKYLGYVGDRPPRGFMTTDRPVRTLADIKGLKLRVPEIPMFTMTYKAWGATPTPLQASDIYSAVRSGMINGIDIDIVWAYAAKYYEIQKYFIAINYAYSGIGMFINQDLWDSFPGDVKKAFLEARQETMAYVNAHTANQLKDVEAKMIAKGCEVIRPDLGPWMKIADAVVKQVDASGKFWKPGLLDRIKALK